MQFPARYTPPLVADDDGYAVHSDGYKLLKLIEKHWRTPAGEKVTPDPWQRWLVINALEIYPPDFEVEHLRGRLRYRQILISVARQNGKSEIAGWIGLYLLCQHVRSPQVLGIASNFDQARIVYSRVKGVIAQSPALSKRIVTTEGRGLRWRDGRGAYYVKPAKQNALQGFQATGVFADELHVMPRPLYDAVVNGMRAQTDALLVGITTAGDDTSELLLSLYAKADESIEDPFSRFGAFIWEAPEGAKLDDPEAIKAANPSIECGRIDLQTAVEDTATEPEHSRKRFLLNQFVSNINAWCDYNFWRLSGYRVLDEMDGSWVAVDVTPKWAWASIAIARKDPETGKIHTKLLATVQNPDIAYLKQLIDGLNFKPAGFAIDAYQLKELAEYAERKGHKVVKMDGPANVRAASMVYSLIVKYRIKHNKDEALKRQFNNGVAKQKGEAWRIVRAKPEADIDALMATVYAIYAAETVAPMGNQMFVLERKDNAA